MKATSQLQEIMCRVISVYFGCIKVVLTVMDVMASSSDRVCNHMNEDHAQAVLAYAWVLGRRPDASRASLMRITHDAMWVKIDHDEAETRLPLSPPLSDAKEARPRLVGLHHSCLAPRVAYVATPPSVMFIMVVFIAIGAVGAHGSELSPLWNSMPISRELLVRLLQLAAVAHVLEGCAATALALSLKLRGPAAAGWGLAALTAGFPVVARLLRLRAAVLRGAALAKEGDSKQK